MDFGIYKALNDLAVQHDWLEDPLRFFALDAQYFFLAVLMVLFFARGKWRSVNGRRGVSAAGFSALLGLGIAQVIGSLWDRPRPYEAHPGDSHLFLTPSPDPSFPSDHATAAFALAFAVFLHHRRAGWLMLAMAALVSVARVAVGTHYPSDVIGGAVLGALSAGFVCFFPPARRVAHGLADWMGTLYERVSDWALRQPSSSAS